MLAPSAVAPATYSLRASAHPPGGFPACKGRKRDRCAVPRCTFLYCIFSLSVFCLVIDCTCYGTDYRRYHRDHYCDNDDQCTTHQDYQQTDLLIGSCCRASCCLHRHRAHPCHYDRIQCHHCSADLCCHLFHRTEISSILCGFPAKLSLVVLYYILGRYANSF